MWLIDCRNLILEEFPHDAPPYAILSHTWESEELVFCRDLNEFSHRAGFAKVQRTCELALAEGIGYAWVDTCCIDKKSSAELTEAINSMYKWYEGSKVCYVYLSDLNIGLDRLKVEMEGYVPDNGLALPDSYMSKLKDMWQECRWFTRGWTLQELVAPRTVLFFNSAWILLGNKGQLCRSLHETTGIDEDVLNGRVSCLEVLVGRRMAWASRRTTTRQEDIAYCLLGIFDVNLPLLYGEGSKAFIRLQEEIIKSVNDLSIFAWEDPLKDPKGSSLWCGILAKSPSSFSLCETLATITTSLSGYSGDYTMTNNGLKVSKVIKRFEDDDISRPEQVASAWNMIFGSHNKFHSPTQFLKPEGFEDRQYILPLKCTFDVGTNNEIVLHLRQISADTFVRTNRGVFAGGRLRWVTSDVPHYILSDAYLNRWRNLDWRKRGSVWVDIGPHLKVATSSVNIYPQGEWDVRNRILFSESRAMFWGRLVISVNLPPYVSFSNGDSGVFDVICGRRAFSRLQLPSLRYFCALVKRSDAVWVPHSVFREDNEVKAPDIREAAQIASVTNPTTEFANTIMFSCLHTDKSTFKLRLEAHIREHDFTPNVPGHVLGQVVEIKTTISWDSKVDI